MEAHEPEGLRALPETRRALGELSRYEDEDLNDRFDAVVRDVSRVAPDCGGLTISYLREGLAFTWLSTGVQVALLDGVQYLDGGPCVDAVEIGAALQEDPADPLSEERWALFARIAAVGGVRSTLSLPILRDGEVVGGVNLYGTTEHAFAARHETLAALFGAWPAGAVTNADLTLTGVQRSRETARTVEDRVVVDQSVGMLTADKGLDSESARRQLDGAADRAGIKTSLLAHVVIKGRLLG